MSKNGHFSHAPNNEKAPLPLSYLEGRFDTWDCMASEPRSLLHKHILCVIGDLGDCPQLFHTKCAHKWKRPGSIPRLTNCDGLQWFCWRTWQNVHLWVSLTHSYIFACSRLSWPCKDPAWHYFLQWDTWNHWTCTDYTFDQLLNHVTAHGDCHWYAHNKHSQRKSRQYIMVTMVLLIANPCCYSNICLFQI
jgi:hypothetical protein